MTEKYTYFSYTAGVSNPQAPLPIENNCTLIHQEMPGIWDNHNELNEWEYVIYKRQKPRFQHKAPVST